MVNYNNTDIIIIQLKFPNKSHRLPICLTVRSKQ